MSKALSILHKQFEAQPRNLKQVREELCNLLKKKGFSESSCNDIVLAVDEACQNIIRHAYGFDEHGLIDLGVYLANNVISIELVDFAPTVAPDCCEPKPCDELKPGGLGTLFMSKLMDTVEFECPPPAGVGNKLVMKRHFHQTDNVTL